MSENYLRRKIDGSLLEWAENPSRKPILLRGTRQVGKSSAVKELAKQFDYFIEVNFDETPSVKELFEKDLFPQQICDELSLLYSTPIIAGKTLLFFDEIQSCIPAISSLRYFYEKLPEIHLIAAGSLLEFALESLPSFGVGRIRSLFLYPFSFDEYLRALGENILADALQKTTPEHPFSEAVHQKYTHHLMHFLLIGGMPEVVASYSKKGSLLECQRVLDDLIVSLYDDFSKYKSRVPTSRLREVYGSVMQQMGGKFTYSKAVENTNQLQIKECLQLLELAGIIYPVYHTSSNGIPLAGEMNPKFRKYLILDTGIFQRYLRLDFSSILLSDNLEQINKGALVELFVGLELIKSTPSNENAQLYYWQREKRGSEAEVDYVVQLGNDIVPIEVKSGKKGSMNSLYQFLSDKNREYGIRCSLENFATIPKVKIYPIYAVSQITK